MDDWIFVTIQLIELNWEPAAYLIFFWVIPSCSLSKRGRNLFENLGLDHESLNNMDLSLWPLNATHLELDSMWCPLHISDITKRHNNGVSLNLDLVCNILLLGLIIHLDESNFLNGWHVLLVFSVCILNLIPECIVTLINKKEVISFIL